MQFHSKIKVKKKDINTFAISIAVSENVVNTILIDRKEYEQLKMELENLEKGDL